MIGHGFIDMAMVKTVFCTQDRDALLNVNGVPYCEAQAKRKLKTQIILKISASKISIRRFVITEKTSWLKAATTAFTFKTLLRHYAKRTLTPRSLNVKLGP